jgi:nitroreductase
MKELTTAQVSTVIADADSVDAAILSRFSARAFINKPVEKSVLEELLQVAARAPSGTNTQPWKVYVVQGATKDKLVNEVCAVHNAMASNPALASEYAESYDYYPTQWVSPSSTAVVNVALVFMVFWASAKVTKKKCICSTSKTTAFLVRLSV